MAAGLAHNYSNCIIHQIHLAFFAGDCFIRVFSVTIYKPLISKISISLTQGTLIFQA